MRIAMIGVKGVPYPGGIENVVSKISTRLVQRGHDVTVYVRKRFQPEGILKFQGVDIKPVASISSKNFDAISYASLATLDTIFRSYDIVHFHAIGVSPFSVLPRLRNCKTVVTTHGLDWERSKWGLPAKAYLRACNFSVTAFPNATTTVSKKNKKYYEKRSNRRVEYIPNGVDPPNHLKPKEIYKFGLKGVDYVLFMARLVPEKGCHYLIDAFKGIDSGKFKLVIAGDDDHNSPYTKRLREEQDDNIIFTGYVGGDLLDELMSNAYIYVLPSEMEGLSTGLLEAVSHGLCILASDIEENQDALRDAGIYFKCRDVSDLRERLSLLLSDSDLVNEYRRRAVRYFTELPSWDAITSLYEDIYCEIAR